VEFSVSNSVKVIFRSFCLSLLAGGAFAQQAGPSAAAAPKQLSVDAPQAYVLHVEDEITIRSLQVKELSDKVFRIDQNGEINFPLLGRIHLAGEGARAAEVDLTEKLKTYYKDPDIAVAITAFHEEPVSVIGAVGTPGIHPIHGETTLLDVLSAAGGVRGDAGPVVKVTRDSSTYGAIPFATAHSVGTKTSMVEINLKSLMSAANSSENIAIQPHDVISVPPAEVIYVIGNVKRAGGFPLGGKPDLTVLQAVSLAEGLDSHASAKGARILRRESETAPDNARTQIPVDLAAVLKGKAPDILLRPNDILYVPNSTSKLVTQRTIEAAIAITTGMLILGR
jgi:polysaccharide export outer membrane protein